MKYYLHLAERQEFRSALATMAASALQPASIDGRPGSRCNESATSDTRQCLTYFCCLSLSYFRLSAQPYVV